MATKITMPKLGLTMKVGIISRWLKNEGDAVKKGEPVVEVMTKKITYKVEAPGDGILLKVVASKGATLPIGDILGVIGAPGEDISDLLSPAPSKALGSRVGENTLSPSESLKISPAARKLAEENRIDYARIRGTGPEGRITREDVQKAIAQSGILSDARPTLEVIPYEGIRKAIGDHMVHSWGIAPKVTHHVAVDLYELLALRESVNSDLKDKDKVSITDFLVKAVAKSLEMKPHMNVTLDGEEIKVLKDIHVGVAIALQSGLIVPVLRNPNQKSLSTVSKELKDFVKRAKRNKLNPDETSGGTFTITNVGGYNSVDWFTPIINQPESAILGVGRIVEKPAVVKGQIVIRPLMGLSLSFDHRVIDGAPAADFLATLIALIEKPNRIFI
jgi:pyruvate dehydrogenase E2 component (dihydrolipoamide acetyltransferase)